MRRRRGCACPSHSKIAASAKKLGFRRISSSSVAKYVLETLNVRPNSGKYLCDVCISYGKSQTQMHKPVKKSPEECYLDVVVEKPKVVVEKRKPAAAELHDVHNYAEYPDPDVEWDANKENDDDHVSPPSPPLSDDDRGRDKSGKKVYFRALDGHEKGSAGPSRPGAQSRAARASSASAKTDLPEPLSLKLPAHELTRYLVDLRGKQLQLCELQSNYNLVAARVQFRNTHPDWSEEIPESFLDSSLLTLRDGQGERDPPLEPVNLLSRDMLLPLTPDEAWYAVVALRKQVLELQVALMYSRIQAKYREQRLQEVTAEHRRYKASVRAKQRRANKEEHDREMRIRQLERRCDQASSSCSEWRLKTKMAEKTGIKKKRRSELLNKGLEEIFTPMQIRVIRTGKKARWTEEDIRRAIELKKRVTRRGYAFIRTVMKIPLPSPMIMKRGANRFEALKPLYEQMVAANLLKYSTKKKPKIPKKEDHAYEFELAQPGLEIDMSVPKKALADESASVQSASTEPVRRKPVKPRKKRSAAQPPLDVEFEEMGTVGRTLTSSSAAGTVAARKRSRSMWSQPRPSWDTGRLWEGHEQTFDEYEQSREERHSRQRPTWSADTADFI